MMQKPEYEQPDGEGFFGHFGGSFISETLAQMVEELHAAYQRYHDDPDFIAEFEEDLADYVGRPSPVCYARRLSEETDGAHIYLKREDLNHPGAHKINNAIGQAMLARCMGKRRIIAETGAGQHGVHRDDLRQGIGLPQVFDQVRRFRESDTDTPVVLMGYANPIERYDLLRQSGAFAEGAASAGVDDVLVDYPSEVSGELATQLRRHDIDRIFLLAPTSTERRIRQIADRTSGYVYCVSIKGITGAKTLDSSQVRDTLARVRRHVRIPVGVGFGIRDACMARDVAQVADAVVIGSWLIESLADKPAAEALEAASDLIRDVLHQMDLDAPEPDHAFKPEHLKT